MGDQALALLGPFIQMIYQYLVTKLSRLTKLICMHVKYFIKTQCPKTNKLGKSCKIIFLGNTYLMFHLFSVF